MLKWYLHWPIWHCEWLFWPLATTFQGIYKNEMMRVKQLASARQIAKCSRYKVLSFNSLVSVYQFFLLEGISFEIVKSDNRSHFSILGILLIFVYIFKLHLVSGIIQRKDALWLFCCFEIRRVDGSHLPKFFKNQRLFLI